MYVVTKNGKKLPVDDSSIDYGNEYVPFQSTVGLYTDNTVLRTVWILTLERSNKYDAPSASGYELELVKKLRFDHPPSGEEVLWAMSAYGLSRGDIARVEDVCELEME